ncbi:hypothetical protein PGTUg99_029638 [Puccinia graminis f. sp. tritici]|uniref:Uncharacterized protein n=2 Tax=Puccinia graminis f. sp. tritici TaxID=56615 RepID=A0A5B0RGS9_PUCGR|nr:hypothetical protein PGTUg99_029638 [Puccinia graminis f. sp. tritici]
MIYMPSDKIDVLDQEPWLDLNLLLDNPTTKKRKYKSSFQAPGMMADDFGGWKFHDEIHDHVPNSAFKIASLDSDSSKEITPDSLEELEGKNTKPLHTGHKNSPGIFFHPLAHFDTPDLADQELLVLNKAQYFPAENTNSPATISHSPTGLASESTASLREEPCFPNSNANPPVVHEQTPQLTSSSHPRPHNKSKRPRTKRYRHPEVQVGNPPAPLDWNPKPRFEKTQHFSEKNDDYFKIFGMEDEEFDALGQNVLTTLQRKSTKLNLEVQAESSEFFKRLRGGKTMVWIFGNTVYRAEPEEQRLKSKYASTLSEFEKIFALKIESLINQGQSSTSEERNTRGVYQLVLQFSDILWINNLRLLDSLGLKDEKYYLIAHALVYRWLLRCTQDDLEHLVLEIFKTALTLDPSKERIYRMSKLKKNGAIVFHGVISETQTLLTEAVILLLATYYKTVNEEKWELVLGNDSRFLSHIVKNQTEAFHSVTRTSRAKMRLLKLFPWVGNFHEFNTYELLSGLRNHRNHRVDLDSYVQVEPRLEKGQYEEIGEIPSELTETGKVDSEQNMDTDSWVRWGWISIILQRAHTVMEKSLTIEFTQTMLDVEAFRMQVLGQNKHFAFKEIAENGFLKRTHIFLKILLELNKRLIETLGHRPIDSLYLEEQNKIQAYFLHLIKSSPKVLSGDLKNNEEIDSGKPRFIQGLIFKAIDCSNIERLYLPYPEADAKVSQQEIIMTEAAAKMLACYYYQNNYLKWKNLFHDEDSFFRSFEKIERRLDLIPSYERFYRDSFPIMQKARLFPWVNPFITTSQQSRVTGLIFRAGHYARGAAKNVSKTTARGKKVRGEH